MDWNAFVRERLRGVTGDASRDADIVEEIAQHLTSRYDELLAGGADQNAAFKIVERELEGHAQLARRLRQADRQRPAPPVPPPSGGGRLPLDIGRDIRYAARLLWRNPGFAAAALITLALGIGMTTSIFSVVQAVLLRPAPFPHGDRLLMVWETDRRNGTVREPAAVPDFIDFAQRSRQFERLGAFASFDMNMRPADGDPIRVSALGSTAGFLDLMGIRPVAGRLFSEEEDRLHGPAVALISEQLWATRFRRESSAIGSALMLNGRLHTVVGVVDQEADFGVLQVLSSADYSRGFADRDPRTRVDVWTPLQLDPEASRDSHGLLIVGRLAPGATIASAQSEMTRITADLERAYLVNTARGAFLEPLRRVIFGRVETALTLLMGAVSLVLLISCVNVANLLLARGTSRVREVAVRTAVGAETSRLLRQFVVENLLMSLLAGGLGIAFAYATLRVLLAIAPPEIPRLATVTLDWRVLLLTFGVSSIVGIVFGFFPLAQVRGGVLQPILKSDDSRGATGGDGRLRGALVVVEVALAVVLAVGAGLLIRSFWHLTHTSPGFDVRAVLKAEFQLSPARYPVDEKAAPAFTAYNRFLTSVVDRVAALPGVESVALTAYHPLDPGSASSFRIVGREAEGDGAGASWPELPMRFVTPGYFRTVGLPMVGGRGTADGDTASSPPVVVANQAFADRFFPGSSPVGHQVRFWGRARTIVGVVANEKFNGVTKEAPFAIYLPLPQQPFTTLALIVRTADNPASAMTGVRGALTAIDPGLPVFGLEPLGETLDRSFAQQRFLALLLGLFAVLALTLASIGVHGVLTYLVVQRTREIGVRMALGADTARVVRLVLKQGAVLTGLGLLLGTGLAALSARWLSGLLFEVEPTDLTTMAGVVGVLAIVAAVSVWLPTRRAVRVDPLVALRQL